MELHNLKAPTPNNKDRKRVGRGEGSGKGEHRPINVTTIAEFIEAGKLNETVTIADLVNAGLAHKNDQVKLLGRGDLTAKLTIEAHAASKSALEKVEKAGGTITLINN